MVEVDLDFFVTRRQPVRALPRRYTCGVMDGECAFCGRADGATFPVFCQDCQAQHRVCRQCLAEATPEAATLGLELVPQAA